MTDQGIKYKADQTIWYKPVISHFTCITYMRWCSQRRAWQGPDPASCLLCLATWKLLIEHYEIAWYLQNIEL